MALDAYRQTHISTGQPREREYRIFAEITRELIDASKSGPVGHRISLVKALARNRRLWQVLQADCSDENNRGSEQLRAGIISLAIWVERHSRMVLRGEGDVDALINVNKTVMEGLAA